MGSSKQNMVPTDNREGSSRKSSIREAAVIAPLSPASIDNSIDNSVKSAQAGKEVCVNRYQFVKYPELKIWIFL